MSEVAKRAGMRFVGPNCLGVANITDRMYAAFGSMTRPPRLAAGTVSMVYQSGGFGHTLALRCAAAGVGFRYLVASGNETNVNTLDLIDYYLEDEVTRTVVAYVEGLADGRALMALGHKACALGKPLLVWKGGRGRQGLRAAASHTASITGRYDIYRAALRQAGIIEVRQIEELADLVRVLASERLPRSTRVGVISASGGSAIVFADAADEAGLEICALSPASRTQLVKHVPSVCEAGNPVDFPAGFLNEGSEPGFAASVDVLLADPNIDHVAVLLATVQGRQASSGARILAAARAKTDKAVYVFSSMHRELVKDALDVLQSAHIPVLQSPAGLAHAIATAQRYQASRDRLARVPRWMSAGTRSVSGKRIAHDEAAAKALLRSLEIAVTNDVVLDLPVKTLPSNIAYPCAVKALHADLAHKTDVGGVALNVMNADELLAAIETIAANVARHAPQVVLTRVLVSEMVRDAVEMIIGVVNDAAFGPTIMAGFGGLYTELLRDVAFRVAPFDENEARAMIGELRGAPLLRAARGRPDRDIDALAAAIARLSSYAWEHREDLLELDVNPLFVRAAGEGVVAADALAVTLSPG